MTEDSNGIQYILGYFGKFVGEEYPRWIFPRHRFQIPDPNQENIVGQFISSTWFNKDYPVGEKHEYLVVGIKGGFSYNNITSLINGALASRGHNRLTELERMQKIVVKEYFVIPAVTTKTLHENHRKSDGFNVTLNNESNKIQLILKLRTAFKTLSVSLPSFESIPIECAENN